MFGFEGGNQSYFMLCLTICMIFFYICLQYCLMFWMFMKFGSDLAVMASLSKVQSFCRKRSLQWALVWLGRPVGAALR